MPRNAAIVETLAWLLADEEQALAHGLHDDVHPSLAAIRMSLEAARHGASAASTVTTVDASLSALEAWARAQQSRVRASLLKRMTLGDALLWYAARFEEERGAPIEVVDDAGSVEQPFPIALALLGHTQEQLNHHVRSAENKASIRLWVEGEMSCVSTSIAKAEVSAPQLRFARLVKAMRGTAVEHRTAESLVITVSIPRV